MPGSIAPVNFNEAFAKELSRLNEQQKIAVSTIEGPVLVIAGPGTGKTQIIATRIGQLLASEEAQAQPHNILCLTYTEAGAIAMRKRLLKIIGTDAHRITIETFHAFCNTVIQQNIEYFGRRELEPISELERSALMEEMLNELDPTHPLRRLKGDIYFEAGRLQHLFSTMKQEDWTVMQVAEAADRYIEDLPNRDEYIYKRNTKDKKKGDLKENDIAAEAEKMEVLKQAALLFPVFEMKMQRLGRYDYHDMILWVINEFRQNENLLRTYQERYQYILVDEFQDTNGAQNEIINLLTGFWESPNIFCVGDDDQGIYEFQGARLHNIMDFISRHAAALKTIVLKENYRSTQAILDSAKRVIDNNVLRLANLEELPEKKLLAALPERKVSEVLPFVNEYLNDMQEVSGITHRILSLQEQGVPLHEIAVLYYRHAQASTLLSLFEKKAIPYQVNRSVNILDLVEVQQLLNMLRYLDLELRKPYTNDALLFEVMHSRWLGLQATDIATISYFANSEKKPTPWLLLLRDEKFIASLPLADADSIRQFRKTLEHWLGEAKNLTLPMLFEKIINEGGYLQWVLCSDDKPWNLQVLQTLFEFVQKEASKNTALTLTMLLNMVEQMQTHHIRLNVEKTVASKDGVLFSTCHSAKGLEFQHVFLMGCHDTGWEKSRSGAKNYSLPDTLTFTTDENKTEALRRLFYVGMTRAKEGLHISYALQNNEGKQKVASRFVTETGIAVNAITLSEDQMTDALGDLLKEAPMPVAAKIEQQLVEKRLQHFALSPSTLNAYLDCPVRFYYENIIRIPKAANDSMAFGSAVHYALQRLFEKMKVNNEVFPAKEEMVNDFVTTMHRNKLSFTEKQFTNRLELGKQLLPAFYEFYIEKWNKQVVLEYFIQDIEVDGIPLKGKLDKIEVFGNAVHVIDYKTGSLVNARKNKKLQPPDEENPLGGDYWRQLVFYKILVDNLKTKNWKMQTGIIDFIEQDAKSGGFHQFPLQVTNDEVAFVKNQIKTAFAGIMNHEFYEGCGKEDCKWCNFVRNNYAPHTLPVQSEE
ncbi:MAG: ATP-dependent helicase [Chitinophagaceae bacterium]|nr:ATP-dependent helicase [Chitinophagaceae bacterium]